MTLGPGPTHGWPDTEGGVFDATVHVLPLCLNVRSISLFCPGVSGVFLFFLIRKLISESNKSKDWRAKRGFRPGERLYDDSGINAVLPTPDQVLNLLGMKLT